LALAGQGLDFGDMRGMSGGGCALAVAALCGDVQVISRISGYAIGLSDGVPQQERGITGAVFREFVAGWRNMFRQREKCYVAAVAT
jgi:hypothetical protein